MKRKRSSDDLLPETHEKALRQYPPECSLTRIIRQYGLLETLVSNLCSDDLLALLLSSKSIYQAIAPRPGSLENLLGRLRCSGKGIRIRQKHHKNSIYFFMYGHTEYIQCGATTKGSRIESRPCINCKVNTCDECRIHCVYQSNFEKPCEEDELPNFSGFVLLSPHETPILSPHHLAMDHAGPRWQDPSNGQAGPYHDQGFIDVPFDDDTFGPPENVKGILNLNLGRHTLADSTSSSIPDPSPVLKAIHRTTEQRKRKFCDSCLPPQLSQHGKGIRATLCQCTLKNRFLDRWMCLRCYEAEELVLSKVYPNHLEQCGCERQLDRELCLWCWGLVALPMIEPSTQPGLGSEPSNVEGSP
ncbi:hypothetical protein EJ02DRAFT_344194 [Clathrospora elynae]|uniref:Uncharacterized protein n=1 Tax=Clathrospora elynae TaxID=706981 RepID=A0A6A5ST21_9PLEO|nr:hypothetical protein EJ02DRAFT_344194 [Clathrospora elynae]